MKRLTAQEAIKQIESKTAIFMGVRVAAYPYNHEKRDQLQKMAEQNEISPKEYWKALKIIGLPETEALRSAEYAMLND